MLCSRLQGRILAIDAPKILIRSIKLREKKVSSTANMLAAVGVGFGAESWKEVDGPSMCRGRGVSVEEVEGTANLLYVFRGGRT
jgi:hypothetical protein